MMLATFCASLISPVCAADIKPTNTDILAVVVHPDNDRLLDQQQLIQLYLNKISSFSDGETAHLLHLPRTSAFHQQFCLELLNLSANQYQSYWSRMLFTGIASDLIFVQSNAQMLRLVQQQKNAVGYLPVDEAKGVRIIGYLQQGTWKSVDTKQMLIEQK